MMSKNSFWVSLKENNKRRLWVWVISVSAFAACCPAYMATNINQLKEHQNVYGVASQARREAELINTVRSCVGANTLFLILITGVALISAVQGFSWLFSRKKLDFYMGMPVKRQRRFLVIWLNGILLYVLPYVCGLLASLMIAAGSGGVNADVWKTAGEAFLLHLGFYLAVYHLALLAVMLTGNIIVTVLGIFVLCIYEYEVRLVDYSYRDSFFRYFDNCGYEQDPLLSPFSLYAKLIDGESFGIIRAPGTLLGLAAFILILGLLSYFCYLKRPSEAAGKALVFRFTKPLIKILLVVPASLVFGMIMADSAGFQPWRSMDSIGYLIAGILFGVVIGCCAIQVIYEFDIRGILHKKKDILLCGVLSMALFVIYRYDVLGYDAYVPEAKEVESVAFIPESYDATNGGQSYFTIEKNELKYLSAMEYGEEKMELQNMEAICKLAEYSMEEYNKNSYWDEAALQESGARWSSVSLIYRLKSGRRVHRLLWVNVEDEKTGQLLDEIMGTEAFQEGYMLGCSEELVKSLDMKGYSSKIFYGNNVYTKEMSRDDFKELLLQYQKDVDRVSFTDRKNSIPVSTVSLQLSKKDVGYYYSDVEINIYPIYENCISFLKEKGYYMEQQVAEEDIMLLQVINNSPEAVRARGVVLDGEAAEGLEGAVTEAEYTDKEDIRRIIPYLVSDELLAYRWDNGKSGEEDYEVKIYFKSGSKAGYDVGYYQFAEGTVPDFVREDTLP